MGLLALASPLRIKRDRRVVHRLRKMREGLPGGIAALFLGCVVVAHWSGYWDTNLPERVLMQLVPRANEFEHP